MALTHFRDQRAQTTLSWPSLVSHWAERDDSGRFGTLYRRATRHVEVTFEKQLDRPRFSSVPSEKRFDIEVDTDLERPTLTLAGVPNGARVSHSRRQLDPSVPASEKFSTAKRSSPLAGPTRTSSNASHLPKSGTLKSVPTVTCRPWRYRRLPFRIERGNTKKKLKKNDSQRCKSSDAVDVVDVVDSHSSRAKRWRYRPAGHSPIT